MTNHESHTSGLLYFMPAWLFERRDLSNTSKLVYSLLSGLAHGNAEKTCYPSDSYIAERLGISRKQANSSVGDLEKIGALRRSMITTKTGSQRIIKIFLEPREVTPPCNEKVTPPCNEKVTQSNKEISNKENLPTEGKRNSRKIARATHVATSEKEHEKLLEDFGEEAVLKAYERLSEWKLVTPKGRWKFNDSLSIRRWVMDALKEEEIRKKRIGTVVNPAKIQDICGRIKEAAVKQIRDGNIRFSNKYVEFVRGMYNCCVAFEDPKFQEKITGELIKAHVDIRRVFPA